jgi:hypothetical protein
VDTWLVKGGIAQGRKFRSTGDIMIQEKPAAKRVREEKRDMC